jgi:hypothetical protein
MHVLKTDKKDWLFVTKSAADAGVNPPLTKSELAEKLEELRTLLVCKRLCAL